MLGLERHDLRGGTCGLLTSCIMHVITLICISDDKRWISNTALWPMQRHGAMSPQEIVLHSPVQSSSVQCWIVRDTIYMNMSKNNEEIGAKLHLFAEQHRALSSPGCRHFVISLLFVVLSLETEFVHQGQFALNLFDVWSCTLSGTQPYLPLEYDI